MKSGWHRCPSSTTDKLVNGINDVATTITRHKYIRFIINIDDRCDRFSWFGLLVSTYNTCPLNQTIWAFPFVWFILRFLPFVSFMYLLKLSCAFKAPCYLISLHSVFSHFFIILLFDARDAHLFHWGEVLWPALWLGHIGAPSTVCHLLFTFLPSFSLHSLSHSLTLSLSPVPGVRAIFVFRIYLTHFLLAGSRSF